MADEAHLSGNFARVPVAAIAMLKTAHELKVYIALCKNANAGSNAWPKKSTIASLAGIHQSKVAPALRRLEKIGLIKTTSRLGTSSVYELLAPTKIQDGSPV